MSTQTSKSHIDYRCTRCKTATKREELTVKRAVFLTMGEKPKTLRSRVVEWLCKTCLVSDPAWQAEAVKASPGVRAAAHKEEKK